MTLPSPSRVATIHSATDGEYTDWAARPRRQTNPDVVRRPSVLLRQATRRSADVSGNNSSSSASVSASASTSPQSPAVERPRTSGHASSAASSSTVTPIKRNSVPSHRSSLSVSALSNPALAEIPSRKYNALRLSTGSAEGTSPAVDSNNNNNNININTHAGNVQCAPPRDMPPLADSIVTPRGAANHASATRTSPVSPSPQLNSFYSDRSRSNSEVPPPSSRRAPTSRPSLSTDSSPRPQTAGNVQAQDRLVRPYSKPPPTSPEHKYNSPSIDAVLRRDSLSRKAESPADPVSPVRRRGSTPLSPRSNTAKTRMALSTLNDPYRTVKAVDEQPGDDVKDSSTDDSRSRSDDVFFNIAKSSVSSRRDSLGKLDRRRKLGLSTRTSLAAEQTPSPEQLKYQSSPLFLPDGSPYFSSTLSTPQLDEGSRSRYSQAGSASRSVVGVPRSRYNRETSPELPQPYSDVRSTITDARYRHSNLTNLSSRTLRQPSTSDSAERVSTETEKVRTDGTTESSLSTTAPSTVWDELDDLKSRIRKLELTGKFPSSSAAAMSNVSAERPRTAATTATTLSSSPKQKHVRRTSVSLDTGTPATPNPIQTLLHSALAKAKTSVGNEVYGMLETTATDALTLANMLTSTTTSTPSGAVSSVNGSGIMNGMTERQARRKADSLCRSLTELCLALSEEQTISQQKSQYQSQDQTRPGSQGRLNRPNAIDNGDAVSTASTRYRRSMSHEPEAFDQQDSASRASGRTETRRANTINFGVSGRRGRFSQDEQALPQTPSLTAPLARLHRLSGSQRLKREDDSDDRSSVFSRTLSSRAMTEVGGPSSSRLSNARERVSREYTNESPSTRLSTSYQQGPSQLKSSPSVQSTIPQRRSYATPPTSAIPTASGANIQPGFRRYGASPTVAPDRNTSDSPSQINDSPQTVPQTRITSSSIKMASSYTAIQPRVRTESLRTESLGTRRLGLRLRPSVIGKDNDQ
ncbi:hypothetical protein BGW36DRAFT_430660 [Talaromyces proteolyticus]|uniref:LPXTG-motif cell wall anchor domain protein n=1 Tax=Talaromyces proteolyticus TaxID=1131652 RepID=A0AAD4KIB9_9EURO|nr:uncharacterized protein BGW36DRAFT_430660 [Talaromyces proteolyticus]KAH8692918.1 hypothetical protein BGW36DRAFT_430660 [Talaromyces proteolyticus]